MNTRMTVLAILVVVAATAAPLGTEFTYQGVLADAGSPAAGVFDFRFYLYDAESGGSQVGSVVLVEDLAVSDGRMTTQLDFGSVFDGTALWLEVGVRDGTSTGSYTVLSPRQQLTAAPFAQHAKGADMATVATSAGNATTLGGQTGAYYLAWSNFVGIPGDLADGDDDTLGDLSCGAGEITRWNGAAWNCGSDDDTPYVRTYVVGPVGTTTQNGTALRNAIAAITPPASQEEAVLLKLEPGVYDIGNTGIEVWGWMTVAGAGRDLTKITGAVCADAVLQIGSSRSGIWGLSVENTCSDSMANVGAVFVSGADVTIEHARIEITGAANQNFALTASGESGGLWVRDVELKAENGVSFNRAINNYRPGAIYEGVTAEAIGGAQAAAVYNHRSDVVVRSSTLKASLGSSASRGYDGQSAYDGVLDDVIVETTSGAGVGQCVNLQLSSGTRMVDVRAVGQYGFNINDADDVTMRDVTVEAVDRGIYIYASDNVVLHDVVVDGGDEGIGAGNGSSFAVIGGWVSGITYTLNLSSSVVTLDGVVLSGGPISGVATCTGCMRNGTFSASGCP